MATLRTLIHTLGARLDSAFRAKTRTQNGFSNPNSRAPEPTNRLNRPRRRTGSGAQHPAKLADRAPRGTLKVAVVERRKVRKAIFAARSGVLDIFNGMSSFGGLGGAPSGYCRLLSDSPDRRNPHPRSSGDSHYEPAERRVPEWTTLRSRFVRSALPRFRNSVVVPWLDRKPRSPGTYAGLFPTSTVCSRFCSTAYMRNHKVLRNYHRSSVQRPEIRMLI